MSDGTAGLVLASGRQECRVPGCGRRRRSPRNWYCPKHGQQAAKGLIYLPIRECEICGGRFDAHSRAERRTCSDVCKQARQNLRRFGLTPQDYRRIYASQDGRCRGCQRWFPVFPEGDQPRLYIDHCHATGRVRGLLCCDCNLALGKMRDDPDTALRLAKYLREPLAA